MKLSSTHAMVVVFVAGCTGQSNPEDPNLQMQGSGLEEYKPSMGKEYKDAKGLVWTWRKKVVFEEQSAELSNDLGPTKEDIEKMSDEEYAERIRPVRLIGDDEYVLSSPDIELAHALKTGSYSQPGSMPDGLQGGPANRGKEAHAQIIGADSRLYFNANGFPERTNIVTSGGSLAVGNGPSAACSMTLIGPSTAISAAHCFYNSGSGWQSPKNWGAGVVRTTAGQTMAYGPVNVCYYVTIPTGFLTVDTLSDDYAVVEFSNACGLYPGNTIGWSGWLNIPFNLVGANRGSLFGYSGTMPTSGFSSFSWPTLLSRSTELSASMFSGGISDQKTIYHTFDTVGGDSGAGLRQQYFAGSGDYHDYVIGIHRGAAGGLNWGRKIDATVVSFVQNNSAL